MTFDNQKPAAMDGGCHTTDNLTTDPQGVTPVSADVSQIERFFSMLYSGAPAGYLTIMRRQRMSPEFIDISSVSMVQAAEHAYRLAATDDVYFGVGLRAEKLDAGKRGDAESVIVLPGLWIDCDIKDLAHKQSALPPDEDAAMLVLRAAGLEPSLVVRSGHGLHGYYLFDQPLVIDAGNRYRVKTLAANLHTVVAAVARRHGWKLDNTSDLARILRPAGTINWKDRQNPKLVTCEVTNHRYQLAEIEDRVQSRLSSPTARGFNGFDGFVAQRECPENTENFETVDDESALKPQRDDANSVDPIGATTALEADFPPAHSELIVRGCAWMRHCRDDAGTLPEPEWHAMLSVLGRCENGEQLSHQWSRPYANYTFAETEKKLRHALEDAGPTTCSRVMDALGQQEFCGECLSREYINSPISLGSVESALVDLRPVEPAPVAFARVGPELGKPVNGPLAMQNQAHAPWPALKVLKTALPPVPAFDPALLPGEFHEFAVDVAERMGVPIDFTAAPLIAALAGIVGRRASITPKQHDGGWIVVPNLWGGIVSRPGNLKTPTINEMFRPLRQLEKQAIADNKELTKAYEAELDGWELRKKQTYGKGGSGTFDEVKPERPKLTRYLVNDATVEKLHAILEDNPQGVLHFRDELTGWFAMLDTKGRERDRPFFLESWSGDGSYTTDRIGRGTSFVEFLCVSLFGGIQPAKLRTYLSDAVLGGGGDDGLMQRLQVLVWPDQETAWHNIDRPPNVDAAQAVERVFRQLAQMSILEPLRTYFSPEAQELFNAWRDELEARVRNGKLSPYLESHFAKYRSLMPTLALLLHIAGGSRGREVPLIRAQQAADWCTYLEAHARRVYACVTGIEDRAAATLSERIKKGTLRSAFTVHDVLAAGWTGLTKPESIRLALGILQDAGWVRVKPRPPGIHGGRPTEDYIVNPAVFHG